MFHPDQDHLVGFLCGPRPPKETGLNPQKLFYEVQKAELRLGQVVESLEQVTGAGSAHEYPR